MSTDRLSPLYRQQHLMQGEYMGVTLRTIFSARIAPSRFFLRDVISPKCHRAGASARSRTAGVSDDNE